MFRITSKGCAIDESFSARSIRFARSQLKRALVPIQTRHGQISLEIEGFFVLLTVNPLTLS
jgi:hypothetical protein